MNENGHRDRENLWGCFRNNRPVFVFEFVHTHTAVWEQSVSPDQTAKAEEKYTPQAPTPEEVLSVWGPTFLSTQWRLARRQRRCLNVHADPGSVRIQPSSARPQTGCTASRLSCAGGFSVHARPRGNIHKYLYNSNVSETSNGFCAKTIRLL